MKEFAQQLSLHKNSHLPSLLFFRLLVCENLIQKCNFLTKSFATVSALASILDANLYRIKDTKENYLSFLFFFFFHFCGRLKSWHEL